MAPFNMNKISREMEDKSFPVSPSNSIQHSIATAYSRGKDDDGTEYNEWDLDDADIPEPPDGGWGWIIVAASFLCNMVVDGIAYTFGIFFMDFVRYYQAPKGKTAWVGSLLSGCYLSAGPLVSALTNRFGCRAVTMTGSVISCVAFLLSTFAPNVDVLMLTYGVLGGIGFGLIYLPAIVSVGYYFSTKRAFATGISVCGSGIGAFVFAPVCQQLLETYDWKGALIILAGLSLNCMVFGALMRPLEASTNSKTKPLLQRIAEEKERLRICSLYNSQFILVQHSDGTVEQKPKPLLNMEPGVHSTLYLDQFGKSPADTPVITLSPIEEARRSPASSREDETEEKEEKDDVPVNIPPRRHGSDAAPPPTNALPSPMTPNAPPTANGRFPVQPSIREAPRRKGLFSARGSMKLSLSNITVNNELKKNSMVNMKFSSSSSLSSSQQNNNYLMEEMLKQLREQQTPLEGSRRSSIRRDRKDFARPLYRKDIFYSGSIVNLPEFKQSQKDMRSYVASVTSIPRDTAPHSQLGGVDAPQRTPCLRLPKSMTDTIHEMLDFSLLKNKVFLMICISNVIGMVGFYVPYVYITDNSVTKGIPADQAAFLLSIIGITNSLGRIVFGWLSDKPCVSALLVNNICIALTGLCVFLVPFCHNYASIVVDCTLFGLFVSAYICLTSIILVDLLGLDKLTNAFGLLSLFRGTSSMLGPPLAGSIYDLTGSYDLPFFIAGGLLVLAAILSFLIPCVARCYENELAASQAKPMDDEEGKDVISIGQESAV